MFTKIRWRLTFLYSGFMGFFLLAFVVSTYFGLSWVVYSNEKDEVLLFAEEEAREHAAVMMHGELLQQAFQDQENRDMGRMFAYAFDNTGKMITAEKPNSVVEDAVLDEIAHWNAPMGEVVRLPVDLPNTDKDLLMMLVALPVMHGEEQLGTVYVGRDSSQYYQLLQTLLYILVLVSLVFLLVASAGGYIMAGRAMIPIKKSYERQRDFVADASHELRTPLSVLMASVEAVQAEQQNEEQGFVRQVLADMKDEIRRMTRLISDLLTLARADAAVINLFKENFDLVPLVEQAVRAMQHLAVEKNIKIDFSAAETSLLVFADKERINQLLLILLDNGIKYVPAGGRVVVNLERAAKADEVVLKVTDNGPGIPESEQAMIFERFYRMDKERSREMGGSGLGLSIAKWITEAHGGTITVKSRPGQGASFIVTLPRAF